MKKLIAILIVAFCTTPAVPALAQPFRFTLPGRVISVQTPPREIELNLSEVPSNGTGNGGAVIQPIQQPITIQPTQPAGPSPELIAALQELAALRQQMQDQQRLTDEQRQRLGQLIRLKFFMSSHFYRRTGPFGFCSRIKPRTWNDPAVLRYRMLEEFMAQQPTIQPVPQPITTQTYGGYQ